MDLTDLQPQEQRSGGVSVDANSAMAKNVKCFRLNSLALVRYPWDSGAVMAPDLSKVFDQNHFAFVS